MAELIRLQSAPSPNLPIAPNQYSTQHYDVLNNVLRLYFNRLDQNLTALFGNTGGKYLNIPYITAYDTTDQYAAGNNTPTKVAWNTGVVNGFTLQSGAAYAEQSGVYKIDYSLQLINTNNVIHEVTVWLRVNGVNVVGSASKFTVAARKSAGVFTYLVAYSHVTYEMNANDYVELWWATDQAYNPVGPVDGIYIAFEPAQTVPYAHPSVPSAVGTITFVSAPQA
jgi:hypothetical protein